MKRSKKGTFLPQLVDTDLPLGVSLEEERPLATLTLDPDQFDEKVTLKDFLLEHCTDEQSREKVVNMFRRSICPS